MLPSVCPSPSATRLKPITSQSLCAMKSSKSHSLRSLAPLLNDSPSPPSPAPRRELPSKLNCATDMPFHFPLTHHQPPISPPTTVSSNKSTHPELPISLKSKASSLNSSSGQPPSPPTPTGHHFYPASPSSYHAYRPEWALISSPVLDQPDQYVPPPRKKLRPLLHSGLRSPLPLNRQDLSNQHQSTPAQISAAEPPSSEYHFSSTQSNITHQPQHADDSPNPQQYHHNNCKLESGQYPHLVSLPRPIFLDEDRSMSSRPLKNTKRAAQNRAAQRAFRERKDRYVRELEARSAQFEEYIVQYGLLEERERLLEAREAALNCSNFPKAGTGSQADDVRRPVSTEDENLNHVSESSSNEQIDYIKHLEHQLDSSRREITRLQRQLSDAHSAEEEMNRSRQKVMDWERTSRVGSRTHSPSDVETPAQASCSSGSLSSSSIHRPSTKFSHSTWARHHQSFCETSQTNATESLHDEAMMDRSPTPSTNLERYGGQRKLHGQPRDQPFDDPNRSPDSIQDPYYRACSAIPGNASDNFEQATDHPRQSFTPQRSPNSKLQDSSILKRHHDGLYRGGHVQRDRPVKLIRLPSIQRNSEHA